VSVDVFMFQPVAEFFGSRIRRRDILQYAANIMGGAHFGSRMRKLVAVDRLRSAVMIELDAGQLAIKIQASTILNRSDETIFVGAEKWLKNVS